MTRVNARTRKPAARSDEDLVAGIRRSNEADFTLLYDRYFRRVYNFAYLRLRNHADTEEVVQEAFTAVFRSIDAFQGKSSVLSWIYGITRNMVNNHIRRAKAQEQRVERLEPDLLGRTSSTSSLTPEEQLTLDRCTDAIRERLATVSEWQAEIFVLRHVDNLTIGEIATRTSRSSDAVRSSLYRVKKLLVDVVGSAPMSSPIPVSPGGPSVLGDQR